MTFLVTLIALLIERFFDWSHLRKWQWFNAYEHKIVTCFQTKSVLFLMMICIVPVLLAFMLTAWVIKGWLYGFVTFLFHLGVLLYCLGPKNLWAGMFAQLHVLKEANPSADGMLKAEFVSISKKNSFQQHFLNHIFVEANQRVFAVVCWFVFLGPIGAVLYRSISLSAKQETSVLSETMGTLLAALDWLPIRIFTFLFALGGHFAHVLSLWRKYVLLGLAENEVLLTQCGVAALGSDSAVITLRENSEKNAIKLLDRVFMIGLFILAMGILIS